MAVSTKDIEVFVDLVITHKKQFAAFVHRNLQFPEWEVTVKVKRKDDASFVIIETGFSTKGSGAFPTADVAIDLETGIIHGTKGYSDINRDLLFCKLSDAKMFFWGDRHNPVPLSGKLEKSNQVGKFLDQVAPVSISAILAA